MHRINVLISSCLYGVKCRYDGKANYCDSIKELQEKCNLIPACAECLAGLSTPRTPCEIIEGKVISKTGDDLTKEFFAGAKLVLKIAQDNNCDIALLKQRSPSCGDGLIYDGSFSGALIPGNGVTSSLLKENGIKVFNETDVDDLLNFLKTQQ